MKDSIVFIDEGNDFASAIQETNNYYVIITREGIPSLPYSVNEIYGIRDSGKYGTLKRTYNEFYHLYPAEKYRMPVRPERIITEKILAIADGAAFGPEMEKLMQLIRIYPDVSLYLPESFEWLILKSGLIKASDIVEMLEHPEDYIESREYFSWEQYFTARLTQSTKESYLKYTKRQLNPYYLQEWAVDKILMVMEGIRVR